MGERRSDPRPKWLFVLWAALLTASIVAGKTDGVQPDTSRPANVHGSALGALFAGATTTDRSTTTHRAGH